IITNFKIENWLLYLNIMKIQFDLNILFNRYLDELNFNIDYQNNIDQLIEVKFNETEIKYQNSLKEILNTIKLIELNQNLDNNEKEIFFQFLRIKLSSELKKTSNNLIKPNDLEKLFNKYLIETNIFEKIIHSLNNQSLDVNDPSIIENINSKSLNNLLPYLTRFWIMEKLE
ncbi:unnamed protein product, partial [Didymodactylos carnosus]